MNKNILQDLDDMTQKNIITEDTAEKIREYYLGKQPQAQHQLMVIFGILGAVLVGLGFILIVAHNWDMMDRSFKTICAVLPMLTGQVLCFLVLQRKRESMVWRESTTAFLFFALGACISLVGQLYNFPGTQASYMISWLLLAFPLMYVMQSSIASVLYIIGCGYYGLIVNFDFTESTRQNLPDYCYWILILLAIPYYYNLSIREQQGSFAIFHHWLIPVSLVLMLGHLTVGKDDNWILNFPLYAGCFALFYQLGQSNFVKTSNGYQFIASVGLITLFVIGTFYGFWKLLIKNNNFSSVSPGFLLSIIFVLVSIISLGLKKDKSEYKDIFYYLHLIYLIIFVLSFFTDVLLSTILCNMVLTVSGIIIVREGAKSQNIGTLNFGLLILSVIVICRYFDLNISFVLRGLLFLLIGTGFILANYLILKKRNVNT